jgi:hypothetical protein
MKKYQSIGFIITDILEFYFIRIPKRKMITDRYFGLKQIIVKARKNMLGYQILKCTTVAWLEIKYMS